MAEKLVISPETTLTLGLIYRAVKAGQQALLGDDARRAMEESRTRLLDALGRGPVYGVNTGFGELKDVVIPAEEAKTLQLNLVRSHAVGVGRPAHPDVVALTALFKAVELARGLSGVRPEVAEALLEVYNRRIHVYIPIHGSVGASGDLAPLAHLALFLVGEGEYFEEGVRRRGLPGDFRPMSLEEKEGLALVNGTAFSLALLTHSLLRAYRLLDRALLALALSFAAMGGNLNALEAFIHRSKRHRGQAYVAEKLRSLVGDSGLVINSPSGSEQDPYCMRCIPQVLGPLVDALEYARTTAENEMNSVSDNPIIDGEGRVYSGCNFHAMYLAQAAEALKPPLAALGGLGEKNLARLLAGAHRAGLSKFLASRPGLDSGLMILQYTVASLVAEARTLASPALIHNIPTSAGQEDVNSMSVPSLIMLEEMLERLEWVVSALTYASVLALHARLGGGGPGGAIGTFYRRLVGLVETRILEGDLAYQASLERLRGELFPEGLARYEYYVVGELVEKGL